MTARSVAALVAFTAGCGQILGVDAYSAADPGTDAASTDLPLLPARPDPERASECEQCVRTQCDEPYAKCLESEPCRRLLSCHGRCSDPSCITQCRDTHAESFRFDDYLGCVFDSGLSSAMAPPLCAGACGSGRNWACAGAFPSDHESPGTINLRFFDMAKAAYGPLSTFVGAEAAPCSTRTEPGTPAGDRGCVGWKAVDGFGRITIDREATHRSEIVALLGAGQGTRAYYEEALQADVPVVSRQALDFLLPSLQGYDPRAGIVLVQTYDCLFTFGAGMRIELVPRDPGVVRSYWGNGYGELDPTLESAGSAVFVNVHATDAIGVAAWLEDDPMPVARKTVLVADGWVTSVLLRPRSVGEPL